MIVQLRDWTETLLSHLVLTEILCLIIGAIRSATAVTCYCTYKDCGSAFCENEYCIVGFRKDDRGIIYQNCASEEMSRKMNPCGQDVDPNWDEVCKCKKNNCNTYQFYRRAIQYSLPQPPTDADGNAIPFDPDSLNPPQESLGFSNSQLIILLICVPLGVGVIAVVFVFINYHCKL